MDDFLKQDIFFFVTTVSVLLVALLLSVLLVYLIRVSRALNHILQKVRTETDIITEELAELRKNIRREGVKIKHLSKFFTAVKRKKN